jgi:serine/threonine protein kinase
MSGPGDLDKARPLDLLLTNTGAKQALDKPLSDQDIRDISEGLSREGNNRWCRVPRIYVVLRLINQIQAINTFIDQGISDLGFPFTQRNLPEAFSDQTGRKDFLEAQKLVLSNVLDFERGSKHYHFSCDSDVPLVTLSELGRGYFGSVDRVRSELSFREYARKLIPRGLNFRKDKSVLREFENELHNLKKLSHLHTVELVGSYTDPRFVGIIMSPVADCNLQQYLEGTPEPSLLRTFFGCLTVAVRFLHENYVRHKDIKPQNVLVYRSRVLLTDFGISRDWTEAGHSTTTGPTTKTPRYCAPEVADFAPRNSSSDIWSLGCVFLEMWTVISGRSISALTQHLQTSGSLSSCYYLNPTGVVSWYSLASSSESNFDAPLHWIQNMLKMQKQERWTAQTLFDQIQERSESGSISFVGHCCDTTAGSPETVETFPDDEVMNTESQYLQKAQDATSSTTHNASVRDLNLDRLLLQTGTETTSVAAGKTIASSAVSFPVQSGRSSHHTSKRSLSPNTIVSGTRRKNRRRSQPHRNIHGPQSTLRSSERQSQEEGHMAADSALLGVPKGLPYSFLLVQNNRFTRDKVMEFIYGWQLHEFQTSRLTRSTRSSEQTRFCYGDYMLPNVVYSETCVRSKPSQYARWSTLESLVEHMTPAVLRGYARFCPDWSEGLASIPTIIATGSATDEVHGMLIFGWHDSHDRGRRKYESKHEHDVQDMVTVMLKDGDSMEVEATLRVWIESEAHMLTPYEEDWQPLHLTDGEWYSLMPKSVVSEDEKLRLLLPSGVEPSHDINGSIPTIGLQDATHTQTNETEHSDLEAASQKSLEHTCNLISELFYNKASELIFLWHARKGFGTNSPICSNFRHAILYLKVQIDKLLMQVLHMVSGHPNLE